MEEIKKWYKNFNYKQNFVKEKVKDNISLYTHFKDNKDTYLVNCTFGRNKDFYLDYFYNPIKIKEINENIQDISVFRTGEKSQIVDVSFDIKTDNINVGILKKKEEMFLEENKKGFVVYSKIVPLNQQDILEIKQGYNIISVQEEENETRINIITEIYSNIPFIFKKIPALIIIKSLLNINNFIEG